MSDPDHHPSDVAIRSAALIERLRTGQARVAVVGLGYVGVPLAVGLAAAGHTVIGIDLDASRVGTINAGRSHIEDITGERVRDLVAAGRLAASTEYLALADADAVIIAVPTPIDVYRVPDLHFVREASASVAAVLASGRLVCLESTSYPGTTEEIVVGAFARRGWLPGRDVFIAYSPERIDPGNRTWTLANTPKLVAGVTPDCLQMAMALYGSVVEQLVAVPTVSTAELSKLFENIFRVVNIALVNELQVICDAFGIDVWEVIAACSSKPFGFMPFYPGPGLGGHCVPVDPFYLAWKAREHEVSTEFIELAGRVNARMPSYVVGKIGRELNSAGLSVSRGRVGVIGVAYKRNTSDTRESPAIKVLELLLEEGATVVYHDPYVPKLRLGDVELNSRPLTKDFVGEQDLVVILADHDGIDWQIIRDHARLTVDTRNAIGRA